VLMRVLGNTRNRQAPNPSNPTNPPLTPGPASRNTRRPSPRAGAARSVAGRHARSPSASGPRRWQAGCPRPGEGRQQQRSDNFVAALSSARRGPREVWQRRAARGEAAPTQAPGLHVLDRVSRVARGGGMAAGTLVPLAGTFAVCCLDADPSLPAWGVCFSAVPPGKRYRAVSRVGEGGTGRGDIKFETQGDVTLPARRAGVARAHRLLESGFPREILRQGRRGFDRAGKGRGAGCWRGSRRGPVPIGALQPALYLSFLRAKKEGR
jgi:hypothetical protein